MLIRQVSKFQAKVSISMVLLKVLKALAVVGLDSGLISLIDDVFIDVSKVLCLNDDLFKVFV